MPPIRRHRVSRRNALQGLASLSAALVAGPFYRTLLAPRRAHAQAAPAGVARRIIFWFTPNGTVHKHWRPMGTGAGFAFSAGSILEPLTAHRGELIVLDGVDFERVRGGSHEGGMEHMLTGGGAISLDQYLAAQIGGQTPFASLELGVQTSAWGASVQTRMSYNDAHQYVHPEDDPVAAYGRIFGGAPVMDPGGGAPVVDPAIARRKSVIDLVKGELSGLQSELGYDERDKLAAHLDALRTLERRLDGVASPTECGDLMAPVLADSKSNERFPDVGALQMDLLVAAAACDVSRVLSLQWTHTVSPSILSWAGVGEGHHELSHKDDGNTQGVADFVASERWFAEQFALFLDKLAATQEPDGSGSLLDTSTVVWVKELGDGRLHDFKSVPFVIAGGGNGHWAKGQYAQFSAQPHQKLLVSLAHSVGVEIDSFGVDDIQGPLAGLTG
jgi:hypothetical protein